jgi:flagellar hook-associated protein 3 FlgL
LSDPDAQIRVLDSNSLAVTEAVSQSKLNNGDISLRVSDAFKHISTMRAEVATSSRRAKDAEDANQDLLAELEKDISEIKDADLASLLTKIQMLMLQKDAAQATFTRISSKSLFDLMG